MKAIVTRVFDFFKTLFLRLRVMVTLQLGQENKEGQNDNEGSTPGVKGSKIRERDLYDKDSSGK